MLQPDMLDPEEVASPTSQPEIALSSPKPDECSVAVAVHIRPLIDNELVDGCQECLQVSSGEPEVLLGQHRFTYDHVFGAGGAPPVALYERCVDPLVEGLFKGYNATVFAYGQTGSGKTFTMGSAFTPGGATHGVIPKVMEAIFAKTSASKEAEFSIRVGFVEIHQEDIRDLMLSDSGMQSQVTIREVVGGGVCLAGANEKEVSSKEEMAAVLEQGSLLRATASTGMNKRSSRSHAIFTITVEQRRQVHGSPLKPGRAGTADTAQEGDSNSDDDEDSMDDYLCAKMHLVDLAGSERAKRTKAEGARLKEGININKGLLALGNVICALSENRNHIPYRDSKLTRMLQDSLGGNSQTVMIACVSPADVNMEESLNTLRYANRARNIRNKPVVNRDPNAAQIAVLRQQLSAARAEITALKRRLTGKEGGGGNWSAADAHPSGASEQAVTAALEELQQQNSTLDLENARLQLAVETLRVEVSEAGEALVAAQAQRDAHAQHLHALAAQHGFSLEGAPATDVLRSHLTHIAKMEKEVARLKRVQRLSGAVVMSARQAALTPSPMPLRLSDPSADAQQDGGLDLSEDEEFAAEEHAHRLEQQQKLGQLEALQAMLEAKEADMRRVMGGTGRVSSLKQHYDKVLQQLETERDQLQSDRADLLKRMAELQSAGEEERLRLQKEYRERLAGMDAKLKEVRVRERGLARVERLKARSEEACGRLQHDILRIKQQKVQLARAMEASRKDFQDFRRAREKELLQLRRQGRRDATQLQRSRAFQEKQQAVLRRKTEEAEAARRRLKEMMAVHERGREGAAARPVGARTAGAVEFQPNGAAPLLRDEKSRREWTEHELDMCCQSFELQRVLEGEKAQRSEAARQLKDLEKRMAVAKSPALQLRSPLLGAPPEGAWEERKALLEDRIKQHSAQILEIQQQLMRATAEEESRGGGAADARRWNGLRTIVEARSMLKTVFRAAATHKAQVCEAQTEVTEAREEAELLRLKLDIAQQEREAALKAAAAVTVAAAASLAHPASPDAAQLAEDDDLENLMDEIQDLSQHNGIPTSPPDSPISAPSSPPSASARPVTADSTPRAEEVLHLRQAEAQSHTEGEQEEDEEEEEEEDEEGDEFDGDEAWDPSMATPVRPMRRHRGSLAPLSNASSSTLTPIAQLAQDTLEDPILMAINVERGRGGEPRAARLTVHLLQTHLRGKVIDGQEWRPGRKNKQELVHDYRRYLGFVTEARQPTSGPEGNMRALQAAAEACASLTSPVVESTSAPLGAGGAAALPNSAACSPVGDCSSPHTVPQAGELGTPALLGQTMRPAAPPAAPSSPVMGLASAAVSVVDEPVPPTPDLLGRTAAPGLGASAPTTQPTTPAAQYFLEQCKASMRRAQALKDKMGVATAARRQPPATARGSSSQQQLDALHEGDAGASCLPPASNVGVRSVLGDISPNKRHLQQQSPVRMLKLEDGAAVTSSVLPINRHVQHPIIGLEHSPMPASSNASQ